jgi:hypothetical protein
MTDILGFCKTCFRMRWLAFVRSFDTKGNPEGVCRSCAREAGRQPVTDAQVDVYRKWRF